MINVGKSSNSLYIGHLIVTIGLGRFWYEAFGTRGCTTSVHTLTTLVHNFRRYHFGT